ncbi:MAG: nucleotidyltransferase domain-containing protein [Acidimicrobiales bacterium]
MNPGSGSTVALHMRRIDDLLEEVARWAAGRGDVRAVALVGSRAREAQPDDAAADDADVDLVVLADDPGELAYPAVWPRSLRAAHHQAIERWGAVTAHRVLLDRGLEVELGFATPQWASTDPLDEGTREVVRAGCRILHDPDALLAKLIAHVH